MKFLVILSALCAFYAQATPTFGGLGGGGSGSVAGSGSSSGGGGLGGIGNLLAIPIGIKKKLLQSHQKRINKHFDRVLGVLNKFGGSAGAGAGATASGNGGGSVDGHEIDHEVIGGGEDGGDVSFATGGDNKIESQTGFAQTETGSFGGSTGGSFGGDTGATGGLSGGGGFDASFSSSGGSAVTQGGGNRDFQGTASFGGDFGGSHDYTLGSSGTSGSSSASQAFGGAGSVQTYHPQPSAEAKYQQTPITVHLYQVESQGSQGSSQGSVQSYNPAPQEFQTAARAEQPASLYGPPDYQPPAPISTNVEVQAQTLQQVSPVNTYLPPNNCQNPVHRHRYRY